MATSEPSTSVASISSSDSITGSSSSLADSTLSFPQQQRQPSGSSNASSSSNAEKTATLTSSASLAAFQQPSQPALATSGSLSSLTDAAKIASGEGDAKADSLSALSFAGIGLHDNLSMINNNSLFSNTDWHSTPVPASAALGATDIGADSAAPKAAEAWGKCRINHDQPWHNNDSEASEDDDPMVWKSKPNNGTDLWEKSTGRKVNWMVNNPGVSQHGQSRGGDSSEFSVQRQMGMQQGQPSSSQQPVPSWLRDDSTIDMFGGGPSSNASSSASVTPTSQMGPPQVRPPANAWSGPTNRMGSGGGGGGGFADDGTPTPTNNHTPNATPAISHWGGDQHDGGSSNFQQNSGWNGPQLHGGPPQQQQPWGTRPTQQPRADAWSNNGSAHGGNNANWQGNSMVQQKNAWGVPVGGIPPPPQQQQRPSFMPPRGPPNMMNGNNNNNMPPNMINGKQMPPTNVSWNQSMSPNHMQQQQPGQRMPPMAVPHMNGIRPNNFGPPPPQQPWGQPNSNGNMVNKPPGPMSPGHFGGMPPTNGGPPPSFGLWNAPSSGTGNGDHGIGSPISNNGSSSLSDGPGSANDIWGNDGNGKPDNQWSDWNNGRTSSGYASDNNGGSGSAHVSGAKSSMAAELHGSGSNGNGDQSSSSHSPLSGISGSNGPAGGDNSDDGTQVWQKKASPVSAVAADGGWSTAAGGNSAAHWANKDNKSNVMGNNNKQSYNSGNMRSPPVPSLPTGNSGGGNTSPAETQETIAHELYSLIKEGFLNREEVSLSRNDAEQSRLLHMLINERRNLATFKQHRDQIMHADPQQAELLRGVMASQVQSAEQKIDSLMRQYKLAGSKNNNVLIQPPSHHHHQHQHQHQHTNPGHPPPMQQFAPYQQHQHQQQQHSQMNSLCNNFNNSLSMSHQQQHQTPQHGGNNFDSGFGAGGGGFFSGGSNGPSSGSGFGGSSGGGAFGMNNVGGGGGSGGFSSDFGTPASVW